MRAMAKSKKQMPKRAGRGVGMAPKKGPKPKSKKTARKAGY